MLTLILTLMILFSPVADAPADAQTETLMEPTPTVRVTLPTPTPDPFPGLDCTYEVMYDERIDAATGQIILVPLGGVPYYGEVDERGVPVGD